MRRARGGAVVECSPAKLKVRGSNPNWGVGQRLTGGALQVKTGRSLDSTIMRPKHDMRNVAQWIKRATVNLKNQGSNPDWEHADTGADGNLVN